MAGYTVPFAPSQPYVNPYVGTIADVIGRGAAARADALRQQGQISASMWQNLGQTVAGSIGDILKQREQAPLRTAQLDEAKQRATLTGMQVADQQRQQADRATLDQALAVPDRETALSMVPGHLRQDVEKHFADLDVSAENLRTKRAAADEAEANYWGRMAAKVKPFLTAPDGGVGAVQIALSHAKDSAGYGDVADQYLRQIQQDPSQLPRIIDSLIQASPEQRKLAGEEADRTLKQQQEQRAITTAQAAEADRKANLLRQDQQLQETIRHNKASEAQAAAGKADTTQVTPAGIDMAALNYKKTGIMPPLGMGDKTTRQRIINRAAELTPDDETRIMAGGGDIATNKATFGADAGSLKKLQAQRDSISAFENTAQKNIDLFLTQANKVADSGSPLLNKPLRYVSGQVFGSSDQATYNAARQVAINEIAKITTNPNLSGTLSDSARHEVEAFNPQTATLKQTIAVMSLLKQDMKNRADALDTQIGTIRTRMGGGNTTTTTEGDDAYAAYLKRQGGR